MKRLSLLAISITALFFLFSCKSNTPKRVVSEVPIKTEVLGLKLCDKTNEDIVEETLEDATDNLMMTDTQKNGTGMVVRAVPASMSFKYGGLAWNYVDVSLNESMQIVSISLVGSYESIENAKVQFDAARQIFAQKYGKGNDNAQYQIIFWTDNTNSVGLNYMESSAINGNDRSFCTLYYVNRALSDAFDKANTPDI